MEKYVNEIITMLRDEVNEHPNEVIRALLATTYDLAGSLIGSSFNDKINKMYRDDYHELYCLLKDLCEVES